MSKSTVSIAKKSTVTASASKAAKALEAVPAVPAPINPHEIAMLAEKSEQLYQKGRELYAQSDDIDRQIMEKLGIGGSCVLPNGLICRVVDNFKNTDGTPKLKAVGIAMVAPYAVKVSKS